MTLDHATAHDLLESLARARAAHDGDGLTALFSSDALVAPEYLANDTPGWEGVLKHGVYHTRKGLGVDESVLWGDFFFVDALAKAIE